MRTYSTLDKVSINQESGVISFSSAKDNGSSPEMSIKREGAFIAISVSHGPLEVALRPKFPELEQVLSHLHPVSGLQTTRQVGTGESYLALGLRDDGALVLRPTIVADATGLLCFNIIVSGEAREALYKWLPVSAKPE
jgi:hypothetical protein